MDDCWNKYNKNIILFNAKVTRFLLFITALYVNYTINIGDEDFDSKMNGIDTSSIKCWLRRFLHFCHSLCVEFSVLENVLYISTSVP